MIAQDAVCYIVTLREIYDLGARLVFDGLHLRVYRVESELRGSELYHTYYLKTQRGCRQPRVYNETICGVSLECEVLNVENIVVELTALLDENKDGAGTRKFIYETIYSSPDGTGWYVMPEPKDRVRLYFPSNDERDGFAKSSLHIGYGRGGHRIEPDRKSLKTKYEKEIVLSPENITITNNKGMTIRVDDNEGIYILSDKMIEISAKQDIHIESKESTVMVVAPESVTLEQGKTKVELKDDIVIDGAKTNIQ